MSDKNTPEPSSDEHGRSKTQNLSKIDPKVLNLLICPKTHGPLIFDPENNELLSKKAKLAYPIREGVPILLIDEARPL